MLVLLAALAVLLLFAVFVRLGALIVEVRRLRPMIQPPPSLLSGQSEAPVSSGPERMDEASRLDPEREIDLPRTIDEMRAYYVAARGPRGWNVPKREGNAHDR